MKKHFTSFVRGFAGLWMLVLALICGVAAAQAAETDLGEVEIGKTYATPMGKITGTITPSSSGTLIKLGGSEIGLYLDAAYTNAIPDTYLGYDGTRQKYSYQVEAGTTYYLYARFLMSGNDVTFFMDGVVAQPLDVIYTIPDEGAPFNFANYSSFEVKFNQDVTLSAEANITCGTVSADVPVAYNKTTNIATVGVFAVLKSHIQAGTINPGDPVTVTLKDVKAASDASATPKDYTFNFACGSVPVRCVSEKVPATIYSYYAPGDPAGLVQLTFDGELSLSETTACTFGWGNVEGADGEFYYEVIKPTLSEDKRTIIADLTGKLRTPAVMTPLYPDATYSMVDLRLVGVVDEFGNPVASEGQGTIGSYSWGPAYQELERVNIVSEFEPANGASLKGVDEVSVYLSPLKSISFTGFRFSWADGSAVVAKSDATVSGASSDGQEATFTFAVPQEVKGKSGVTLTLDGLSCTDGYDHNIDVQATYDAFVITYSDPKAGSLIESITQGMIIDIATNYDDTYPELYLTYEIEDMNPDNPDEAVIKSMSWFRRSENGGFTAEVYGNYKLYRGHTYRMNVTAWESEADSRYGSGAEPLGTAYVQWQGGTAPYIYSEDTLVSIDPVPGTTLSAGQCVFTLTYTGQVHMDAETTFINIGMGSTHPFEAITAIDGEEYQGLMYSSQWTLTVSESFMESLTSALDISFVATDVEGRRVLGNLGKEENTYFYYVYEYAGAYAEYDLAVVGETPYKSVRQFVASSERGISFSYYNAVGDAYVVSRNQAVVARVASWEAADTELGSKCTSVTLTLDTEITEEGGYMLIVPQGYFVIDEEFSSQQGAAMTLTFDVDGGGLSDEVNVQLTPAPGTVTVLPEDIEIIFPDYDSIGLGSGAPGLTIDGGDRIKLGDADLDWDIWNMATVHLPQEYTEAGTYVLDFPEGYFNLGDNGDPSPALSFTYVIAGAEVLNYTTDPAEGFVDALSNIEITFTDEESVGGGMGKATLSIDGGEAITLPDAGWGIELNQMEQPLGQTYTEEGTYVISFPAGYFMLGDDGRESPAFTLTYTIKDSGIAGITIASDGLFHIYTVDGIEVARTADKAVISTLTPGIYVINGVKILVK